MPSLTPSSLPPRTPVAGSLDAQLAALRSATADALPPPATDRAIAAAIAAATAGQAPPAAALARTTPSRSVGERWLAWPLALAASIAVLSFVVRSVPPDAIVAEPAAVVSDAGAFMPVVPLAEIQRADDALVVPARVPRTALAALGLPIDPARAADAVDTELLVRPDGAVLAVRFIF